MRKFTSLMLMLLCAVTTWAADFTLSNGSSSTLAWSSDGSSTCAPWANTAVTDLPEGLTGKTVTKTESTVTISENGAITVTFQYNGGSQRLDMDGVDLVDANGNVVASDYHHGFTGNAKDSNVYTLVTDFTGDYTLRYWVTQGDYLYNTNGNITVTYENTAAYERRVAVEKITPVIASIRNSIGSISITASNLSSNGAFGYAEGSLANLLDGNNTSYFQTNWSSWGGEANASHYIQIDLSEGISVENFYLEWTTRNNGSDVPQTANIIASTTGEDGSWDTLQEGVASTAGAASTVFKSNTFGTTNTNGEVYKYVRFVCTFAQTTINASNTEYAFGLAEFAIKTEPSEEDLEMAALCDAAQAVIDDETSTAADINEQFKTLKLATVEKPTYPFTITTDDANPVLYVIKSGRDGNPSFTLADDGYISLAAFTGADTQVWYFKEVVNADYEYVLNIIPYAVPATSLGYTSTSSNHTMVSNSSSNTCNEWVLDQNYSKLGIKPYTNQSTYLSNFGGTGNKMGFWTGNPDADAGTALYITLAIDEVNTLLENLITTAEGATAGTAIGSYTESAIAGLATVITEVKAVKENATATYAEKVAAIATLNNAISSLEVNLPEDGKLYTISSAALEHDYCNGAVVYAGADNKLYWSKDIDAASSNAVFKFTKVDGGYKVTNIHTASNITNFISYNPSPLDEENAGTVVVSKIAGSDSQVRIDVGNTTMHTQSDNNAVVNWASNPILNSASAFHISEVKTPVYSHAVSSVGYSTLILGFDATIPAGVECYYINETIDEQGIVKLAQVEGTILPKNTAVVVKLAEGQDAGDFEFAYSATAATAIEGNQLAGTLYNKNITAEAYVLSAPDNKVGLYKAELADGAFLNNANKAYFVPSTSTALAGYSFSFDWAGTTGIEGVEAEGTQNGKIYDITGREVKAITAPGIYIVNGRKVVK